MIDITKLNCKELATALEGMRLHVGKRQAIILEAQGYTAKENSYGVYQPLLEMMPGLVYIARHRNAFLTLLSCNDKNVPGGCVLLRSIEAESQVHKGPGAVSKFFGFDEHASYGEFHIHSDEACEIRSPHIEPTPSKIVNAKRIVTSAAITDKVLARYMQQIVAAYRKMPTGSFEEYVNNLVATCGNESALKRALR
jgi:hypothetical protein